jgi:uncharacterized protein YbjT (DUF2867 family)
MKRVINMGSILITGLTGNVGKYIYESLIEMNQKVIGAVTSISKSKAQFADIDLVEFNFLKEHTFEKALEGVNRVFLMRPPHLGSPEDLYPFIDAMKRKNIKLVIFLSLMGIEKNSIPPHHKIEKYIEKVGIPYCHIRPGFFMQNLSDIHANEIKESNSIFIPAGNSRCSFIDTKDIGYSVAKILSEFSSHENTAYTITGGESLNYYQIADTLSEVLKRKITYLKPSWLRFRQYMIHERKIDKKMVNVMVMLYFMTRLGTAKAIYYDFEKITGRKPRTIRQFAEENINAWL